nr:hypothetical protein [Kibdelosporangium sp. MJ126-NF4]
MCVPLGGLPAGEASLFLPPLTRDRLADWPTVTETLVPRPIRQSPAQPGQGSVKVGDPYECGHGL